MAGGQGQTPQPGAPQGGAPKSPGGGGGKMRLGDVLTDIVAPTAAVIGATYGPRYAGAAAIGMHAVDSIKEGKRRRALGQEIVRLSDLRADEELSLEKQRYEQLRKTATKLEVEDSILEGTPQFGGAGQPKATQYETDDKGMEEAAAYDIPDLGMDFVKQGQKITQTKNEEFMKKVPEPIRNQAYDLIASIASQDPDAAMQMLSQRDMAQARLKEMIMSQVDQHTQEEAKRKAEQVRFATTYEFQNQQAQAEAEYRKDMLENQAEERRLAAQRHSEDQKLAAQRHTEQMALGGAELASRERIAGEETKNRMLRELEGNIAALGSKIAEGGLHEDEAVMGMYNRMRDEHAATAARFSNSPLYVDHQGNVIELATGKPYRTPGTDGATQTGTPARPGGQEVAGQTTESGDITKLSANELEAMARNVQIDTSQLPLNAGLKDVSRLRIDALIAAGVPASDAKVAVDLLNIRSKPPRLDEFLGSLIPPPQRNRSAEELAAEMTAAARRRGERSGGN